jgi:6-phosphofructokinase 2
MAAIITVTFSPCIDKSTTVPELLPEKKLKCSAPQLAPGGGGINVARAIIKLGGSATAVYPSGGYTGKFFKHLLAEEGVPSIIIETANETRENIIVVDEKTNRQYRFGMPGTPLKDEEWKQCLQSVEEAKEVDYVIASGSLPPGVPPDALALLGKIAKNKNAKFILDTSGEALKKAVNEGVYLLKPNLGELSTLAGTDHIDPNRVEEIARSVIEKYRCEVIVASLGKDGAALITSTESHLVRPPEVIKKSTVGAGDSMVAGIVFSLAYGRSLKEALQYGVACGTAATLNEGTELCKKKDADRLYSSIRS